MKKYIIVSVILLFTTTSYADCSGKWSFFKESYHSKLVALVRVNGTIFEKFGHSCTIIDIIKCEVDTPKSWINIWGYGNPNAGFDRCLITSEPGDTIVVALQYNYKKYVHQRNFKWNYEFIEAIGTFHTTGCGNNFLKYKNNYVHGIITMDSEYDENGRNSITKSKFLNGHVERIKYKKFKKMLVKYLKRMNKKSED